MRFALRLLRRRKTSTAKSTQKFGRAKWAGDPAYYTPEYRVLHFRRSFDLPKKPESFKINVSADQRFVLYVNGGALRAGPARGDLDGGISTRSTSPRI